MSTRWTDARIEALIDCANAVLAGEEGEGDCNETSHDDIRFGVQRLEEERAQIRAEGERRIGKDADPDALTYDRIWILAAHAVARRDSSLILRVAQALTGGPRREKNGRAALALQWQVLEILGYVETGKE